MRVFFFSFAVCAFVFFSHPAFAETKSRGNAFNPDIGVNLLGLAQHGTSYSSAPNAKPRNGFSLQEAELQFSADVDPYLRATALFAIAQENGSASYSIAPEEAYVETISLPYVTLRAGKFKMALGKHNQLHTHAFPFIYGPLVHTRLLGDEGLNETGVSASALIPLPWYSELTLQAFTLKNEALFGYYVSGDMGGLARLRNLWDFSDSLTMELGFSGARGKNSLGRAATVAGSDLTFKWRPTEGGRYRAFIWSTEYLYGKRQGLMRERTVLDASGTEVTVRDSQEQLGGISTWVQYQFAERWWVQARFEKLGFPRSPGIDMATKESALLAFLPSEFSALRLQYDLIQDKARPRNDQAIAFQYNVSIGAHPAHAY